MEYKWELFAELKKYGVKLSEDEKKYMNEKMDNVEDEGTGEISETYETYEMEEETMEAIAGWFEGVEEVGGFIRRLDMEEQEIELVKIEEE